MEKEIEHITRSLCVIRRKRVSRPSLLVTNEKSGFTVKCDDACLLANTCLASRKQPYSYLTHMANKIFARLTPVHVATDVMCAHYVS